MTDTALLDRTRWNRAWQDLDLEPPADLYDLLLERYGEPHRKYHSPQHLADCLRHLDDTGVTSRDRALLEIALWFHDAIYDTHRSDNEVRSARWAHRALLEAGAARSLANAVRDLVLATRHQAVPADPAARLIADIDLTILGADPDRYDQYEGEIRREYGWVPGFVFRRTRTRILKAFLDRPSVFVTPEFASRYEQAARANLARELEDLARGRRRSQEVSADPG